MSLLSKNTVPAEPRQNSTIGNVQKKTRNKVFGAIGRTVELGVDVIEFTAKTGAYVAGRAVPMTINTVKAGARGVLNRPPRHAA